MLLVLTAPNPLNAPGPNDIPEVAGDALVAELPFEVVGGHAGRVVFRFVGGVAQRSLHVLPSMLNWRVARSGVGTVVYEGIDEAGRHGGMRAWITREMLDKGTHASDDITPPGWLGNGTLYNQGRGHLLARILGGHGNLPQNLITIVQNPINSPVMRGIEQRVYNAVEAGETVEYLVKPIYRIGARDEAPTVIRILAVGDRGLYIDEELLNFQ